MLTDLGLHKSVENKWDQRRIRIGVLLAGTSLITLAAACDTNKDSSMSFQEGGDLAGKLHQQYNTGQVTQCAGTSLLRTGGHVRTAPDATQPNLILPNFTELGLNEVEVTNPQRVTFSKPDGKASKIWYMAKASTNETVFINHDALHDNFKCVTPTDSNATIGSITIKPFTTP